MIAVGAVIAADQIEQSAFGLIEAVHGSRTFAQTKQAVRQVARPAFGRTELTEHLQPAFATGKGIGAGRL